MQARFGGRKARLLIVSRLKERLLDAVHASQFQKNLAEMRTHENPILGVRKAPLLIVSRLKERLLDTDRACFAISEKSSRNENS
jgi:hypothetical protein